jgi:hypothetical protein
MTWVSVTDLLKLCLRELPSRKLLECHKHNTQILPILDGCAPASGWM